MRRILNFSEQVSDDELETLMSTLLFYFVERCGGDVTFSPTEARQTMCGLSTKMLQMRMGDEIQLRVITRPTELRELGEPSESL
jgi:hypothetical protein